MIVSIVSSDRHRLFTKMIHSVLYDDDSEQRGYRSIRNVKSLQRTTSSTIVNSPADNKTIIARWIGLVMIIIQCASSSSSSLHHEPQLRTTEHDQPWIEQQQQYDRRTQNGEVCSGEVVRRLGTCLETNRPCPCSQQCDSDPTDSTPILFIDAPTSCTDIYDVFCPLVNCCSVCTSIAVEWYQCSANNVANRWMGTTCDLTTNCLNYPFGDDTGDEASSSCPPSDNESTSVTATTVTIPMEITDNPITTPVDTDITLAPIETPVRVESTSAPVTNPDVIVETTPSLSPVDSRTIVSTPSAPNQSEEEPPQPPTKTVVAAINTQSSSGITCLFDMTKIIMTIGTGLMMLMI
jgi:hypothetical protein